MLQEAIITKTLENGLAEVVVEGIKKQGDANLLWEGWEKGVFAGVKDGTANWIATKDGVTIWYNPGDIAAYAAGSITVSVNVSDYPELFVEQYIGAYGNQQLEKVTHQLATEGLSAFYTEVLPLICDGMGTATWKDIRAILDARGILYEGLDDDEALEYEMQPFFKLKEGKEEFYLYFFPMPDATYISTISMYLCPVLSHRVQATLCVLPWDRIQTY